MALRAIVANPGPGGSLTAGGYTDGHLTPGNATINTPSGQNSFAGAATTCVITNSSVTANSIVLVQLQTQDATLTTILTVGVGPGSFTVTGNAAATSGGAARFRWVVIN